MIDESILLNGAPIIHDSGKGQNQFGSPIQCARQVFLHERFVVGQDLRFWCILTFE